MRKLGSKGRYCFTFDEFKEEMKLTSVAAKFVLIRWRKRGLIATPATGFNIVLPPEYMSLGCLPPEQFIDNLMKFLRRSYYVGLLSAAELHGSAHQRPQIFQVMVNKRHRPIQCGKVRVEFVLKKDLNKATLNKIKTGAGYLPTSTPETTIFDLMRYIGRAGGLSNVATVINGLVSKINGEKAALLLDGIKEQSLIQRTGYLLERVLKKKKLAAIIYEKLDGKKLNWTPLVRLGSRKNCAKDGKWKIIINEQIEVDE